MRARTEVDGFFVFLVRWVVAVQCSAVLVLTSAIVVVLFVFTVRHAQHEPYAMQNHA